MSKIGFPLISIGIPAYNKAQGLDRLLASMTAQTFCDVEIIVSDDCSPDPEVQCVAERYAARVRVFRQPSNLGLLGNHQFVKDQARGKYFMWANDDDEFPTNYVEACLRHFSDAPDVVLVGANCTRLFDGKYRGTYENRSSVGVGTFDRLKGLMPDGFFYHWRFEQYLSGLALLSAMPRKISLDHKSQFYFFFCLSSRGTLAHAPEVTIVKYTTQENFDRYASGSIYRRRPVLRHLDLEMQTCTPIACQMVAIVWRSGLLTWIEKLHLTARCAALFVMHPLRDELQLWCALPSATAWRARAWVAKRRPLTRFVYRRLGAALRTVIS